ncbi:MAG: hypothetical protein R6V41_04460 [Desulfobacteraceae bacterium]
MKPVGLLEMKEDLKIPRYIEKWWHLDTKIVNSVRYHHLPFMGLKNDRRCEQLVHRAMELIGQKQSGSSTG